LDLNHGGAMVMTHVDVTRAGWGGGVNGRVSDGLDRESWGGERVMLVMKLLFRVGRESFRASSCRLVRSYVT